MSFAYNVFKMAACYEMLQRQKPYNVPLTGARRLARVRVERVVGRHYQ
jgi:hypothetical protein